MMVRSIACATPPCGGGAGVEPSQRLEMSSPQEWVLAYVPRRDMHHKPEVAAIIALEGVVETKVRPGSQPQNSLQNIHNFPCQ